MDIEWLVVQDKPSKAALQYLQKNFYQYPKSSTAKRRSQRPSYCDRGTWAACNLQDRRRGQWSYYYEPRCEKWICPKKEQVMTYNKRVAEARAILRKLANEQKASIELVKLPDIYQ